MRKIVDSIFQHPAARALILIVLVIPLSVYVGSSPVRRGFLYYTGVFAPAFAAAAAAGLWTWSWKWFWLTLVGCGVLTLLIQVVLTYAGITA
jgi:hypothetical protein